MLADTPGSISPSGCMRAAAWLTKMNTSNNTGIQLVPICLFQPLFHLDPQECNIVTYMCNTKFVNGFNNRIYSLLDIICSVTGQNLLQVLFSESPVHLLIIQ